MAKKKAAKKPEPVIYPPPFMTFTRKQGRRYIEFYLLDVGQCVERWGGSRQGLCAQKTASVVARDNDAAGGCTDYEYSLNAPAVWDWIRRLSQNPDFEMQTQPIPQEVVDIDS